MKKEIYVVVAVLLVAVGIFWGGAALYQKNIADSEFSGPTSTPLRADPTHLVREWSPRLGPSMAKVVIVEFLDPECEACRAMDPLVKNILKDYDGRVQYVVRYMPFHSNSVLAAKWLEAAREQNRYWEALETLFKTQPSWGSHHAPRPQLIPSFLREAQVDIAKADVSKENPEYSRRIEADRLDGMAVGVVATPTFFVNGRRLMELGDAPLRELIESELNN